MIMGTVECQETVNCTSFLGSLATFHTVRKPKNQAVMLILVVSRVNKRESVNRTIAVLDSTTRGMNSFSCKFMPLRAVS